MKKMVLALVLTLLAGACDSGLDVDEKNVADSIMEGTDGVASGNQSTDAAGGVGAVTTDSGGSNGALDVNRDTAVAGSDATDATDKAADTTGDMMNSDEKDTSDIDGIDSQTGMDTDTGAQNGNTEVVTADTTSENVTVGSDEIPTQDGDTDSAESVENDDSETAVPDSDSDEFVCEPALVINEVDYDVPGKDTAEFVELLNPTDCAISVAGLSLVLVNGSNAEEYRRVSLEDAGVEIIGGGEYMVIHGDDLAIPESALNIPMSYANGFIQNGPDGLAIFDEKTGTVLDAFCYGTAMTEVIFKGVDGVFNLVEGELNPSLEDSDEAGVSISRIPDGADSQSGAADWAVTAATPGEPNARLPQ
jgi:hypothetical protein